MAWTEVNGIGIAYEIIGEGPKTACVTPGGRFSKDTPGIRGLAEKIAAAGYKVLIWDRPNCGASDLCFDGETESFQNADTLAGLLRQLDFGPTLLIGGSGGARDTLLCSIRHPDVVRRIMIFWITGGAIGIFGTAYFYYHDSGFLALKSGMEAVTQLPNWAAQIAANPKNRDRLLAFEPMDFFNKLQKWGDAFFPQSGVPMPGVSLDDFVGMTKPALVLRSSHLDPHHSRATSEKVASLLPNATMAEPPWGEREWLERGGTPELFGSWPMLAEQALAFDRD